MRWRWKPICARRWTGPDRDFLPAHHAAFRPRGGRLRGAAALAPSRQGSDRARRFHRPFRGNRPDRGAGPLCAGTGGAAISPIGSAIFRCRRRLFVSVNLSRRQLRDPGFEDLLTDMLSGNAIAPGTLNLEVTESAVGERRQSGGDAGAIARHWAPAWRSTISAPAPPASASSATCRSTRSRSTKAFSPAMAGTAKWTATPVGAAFHHRPGA